MVGMICTQYKRHFLVCPRAISTQVEPGTSIGTEAMACRTVSAVGPSESLHVSGRGGGVDGFAAATGGRRYRAPEPAGPRPADDAHGELSEHCECPLCFVGTPVDTAGGGAAGNLAQARPVDDDLR